MKDDILKRVLSFFVESKDFNGILVSRLGEELNVSQRALKSSLRALVKTEEVSLVFASHSINPHIKRVPDLSIDEQMKRLKSEDLNTICAYPTTQVIRDCIDLSAFSREPFKLRLALAEPQLTPVFFDLDVLDKYYRDPRYLFSFHDLSGSITIQTDHYDSPTVADKDKVFLESFGIGYDSQRHRVVAAFLRYLAAFSPEHQQIWNAYAVADSCTMNSDYERATIYGYWYEHYSAYQAFLTEQAEINKLAQLIGKPPLFRKIFENERPEGFNPMLRPTKRDFEDFVHLLDKMLSENINQDFFKGDIDLERQVTRADGSIEVQRKGSLQLFEEWIGSRYRTADGEDVAKEVIAPLKEIRKLRQKPAHLLQSNEYDRSYPNKQDEVLGKACRALTKLRLILWSHPKARERYEPPNWLDSNNIVFY